MKKFGLIGGTSWHSTVEYYTEINRAINECHGNNTNPQLVIESLNQKQIHDLQCSGDWGSIAGLFIDAAHELHGTGVKGIAACANTSHKIYEQLVAALDIPVLHIADAIAMTLKQSNFNKVGLIGTRFTMEEEFIRGRLRTDHQIDTVVPPLSVQREIQNLIYDKLSVGIFDDDTKHFFLDVIESLSNHGAQSVILGCTEFPLLLKDTQSHIPLVDSLKCHCRMIVQYILGDENPEQSVAVRPNAAEKSNLNDNYNA